MGESGASRDVWKGASLFSSDGEGRDGGSRLIHVCGYKNAKGKGESEGACI